MKGVFNNLYCCYDNLLRHENVHNLLTNDWALLRNRLKKSGNIYSSKKSRKMLETVVSYLKAKSKPFPRRRRKPDVIY